MTWINVKDRLPELEEIVLVFLNNAKHPEIRMGWRESICDETLWLSPHCNCNEYPDKEVTYWMELPDYPSIPSNLENKSV